GARPGPAPGGYRPRLSWGLDSIRRSPQRARFRGSGPRIASPSLLQQPLALHRQAHVALDLELLLHECGHRVELAGRNVHPVVRAGDEGGIRTLGRPGRNARGAVIDPQRPTLPGQVELVGGVQAGDLIRLGPDPSLDFRKNVLGLGHVLLLYAGVAAAPFRNRPAQTWASDLGDMGDASLCHELQ